MREDEDRAKSQDEDVPRQGLLASVPRRAVYRVLVLLAALAGILYLRQQTGSIASCMSQAFVAPAPAPAPTPTPGPVRANIKPPAPAATKTAP
jgi:hypothetical protein